MPRLRRFLPPEYKAEVVELIRSTGKTVGQVASELDLTALLRCVGPGQAEVSSPLGSDRQDQFVERDHQSPIGGLLDRQFVVSAPKVLDEGVSGDDHPGAAVLFEATHWSQPRLVAAVIRLDPVVGVLFGAMPRRREEFLQHGRVHRRLVGGDLDGRDLGRADGLLKESVGSLRVPACGDDTSMTCPNWSIAR
jgi:hypothetical protein